MINNERILKNNLKINPLGLGMGSINESNDDEIFQIISKGIENGINFFDLCAGGKNVYQPFGKAIKNSRDSIYIQLHFGAVYKETGDYGWSRNLEEIKQTFEYEMQMLHTDYIDFGILHCIDDENDLNEIINNGILNYLKELKDKGIIKHIGFSSHTPSVANKLIETKLIDIMMFSINPAYDLEKGDEYGIGTNLERNELFKKCESLNIPISVMKPFHGGQLLDEKTSPFKVKLSKEQCIKYCLDRPSVMVVVPGVKNLNELNELLNYNLSNDNDKDYSIISNFTPINAMGNCVYCNHCLPCPKSIDIGLINKYYDLAISGDKLAFNHYDKLKIKADECIKCGYCNSRCPFKVNQQNKMEIIKNYFSNNQL